MAKVWQAWGEHVASACKMRVKHMFDQKMKRIVKTRQKHGRVMSVIEEMEWGVHVYDGEERVRNIIPH